MKRMMQALLLILAFKGALAFAVTEVTPGTPIYGGNGCPKNSVAVAFAPDGLSFSVIYDKMVIDIAAADKHREKVKLCSMWIPIQLPAGTALEIENIDYRGFVALPTAGKAAIHAAYGFWPGARHHGPTFSHFTRKFKAPYMDEYTHSTGLFDANHKPQSACGGKVYLQLADWLQLQAKKGNDAQVTLDSIDGSLTAKYAMNLKKCK